MLLKGGLLLLFILCAEGNECECHGKCGDPKLDWVTDCPEYGYDCQRSHSALTLFRRHVHGGVVTLKCADSKATLFVKGKNQRKLKCRLSSSNWKGSDGCEQVQSALCALSCTTCSTRVPGFLTIDAVSVSVLPAMEGRACSIGFCDGVGLTLVGIDAQKTATTIDGNVTCTGNGWMDRDGRVYKDAICTYNSCPSLTAAPPASGTVPTIGSGTRAVDCPPNSELTYTDATGTIRQTQYSLMCGASGTWELYGEQWSANDFTLTTCTTFGTCTATISPPDDCDGCVRPSSRTLQLRNGNITLLSCDDPEYSMFGTVSGSSSGQAGYILCSGNEIESSESSGTITKIACKKSKVCSTDIGDYPASNICADDPSLCSTPIITSSSITCKPGAALVYTSDGGGVFVSAGNLTCFDTDRYYDTGLPTRQANGLSEVVCVAKSNMMCDNVRPLFAPDGVLIEQPPNSTTAEPFKRTVNSNLNRMEMHGGATDAPIYYNDNFNNVALSLYCGDDRQWYTPDNTLVTSASVIAFSCPESLLEAPPGYDPVTPFETYNYCPMTTVYQVPGGEPIILFPNFAIFCGPNNQYVLGFTEYFLVPAGTLIGCG